VLERALVEQSLVPSKSEEDVQGGGKGALIQEDKSATLSTLNDQYLFVPVSFHGKAGAEASLCIGLDVAASLVASKELMVAHAVENHPADGRVGIDATGKGLNLASRMGTGGGDVPMVMETYQRVTGPLMANSHPGSYTGQDAFSDMLVAGYTAYRQGGFAEYIEGEVGTLRAAGGDLGGGSENLVVVGYNQVNAILGAIGINGDIAGTLDASYFKGRGERQGTEREVVCVKHIVRRLTPLECERLQGFPDGWTDIGEWVDSKGKKHKEADSPRYKALGNSIAIPPWKWVLKRLCACYERDATMASLFDGIGGFPYIWEQLNGKGSCLWASEIEEFPMAVTKVRFGE
jgi:DNA (cytosine-5)-methyltransferase 1